MVEKQGQDRPHLVDDAGAVNHLRSQSPSLTSLLSVRKVRNLTVAVQPWSLESFGRTSRAIVAVLAAFNGLFAFVGTGAAQAGGGGAKNVCNTQMGGFINAITSSVGTIAIAAIVLAILVGVAARPFVRSGNHHSALNGIMSKAFTGLVILIIAIPVVTWGLTFTPFAPTLSCIPFLGG